jgi:hypothetical protein
MVVHDRSLIAGNFSEPITTALIGERALKTRARRIDGGYSVSGRKMFASMLEAADYVLVMAYPVLIQTWSDRRCWLTEPL